MPPTPRPGVGRRRRHGPSGAGTRVLRRSGGPKRRRGSTPPRSRLWTPASRVCGVVGS